MARRRILVITRNYPPLLGGMERLVHKLTHELASEFDLALCGPAGCTAYAPAGTLVREAPVRPLALFLLRASASAMVLARRFKPDLVIAGSGVTAPIARAAAGRAPVAVYLHGLDLVTRNRVYRALWLPAIRRCSAFLVNSRYTAARAREAGCAADRISVLHPGTEMPVSDGAHEAAAFRAKLALGDAPLLLSVGRLTRRKGLVEFIDRAFPAILAAYPRARLLVVGDEARDALGRGAGSERERIRQAADRGGFPDRVILLGACDDASLAGAYAAADCLVFPVQELPGDAEGFGMVALEAAAHGTPTVAFDRGGVADAVRNGESGWLVEGDDYERFAARVIDVLGGSAGTPTPAQCTRFARTLAWSEFGARARMLCNGFIDGR